MKQPVRSDYVFHPPSGSSLPGKVDPNPYVFYPPEELRKLVRIEKNEIELAKILSALKQWERIYVFPGYPWRKTADLLRRIAGRILRAELPHPSLNIPYYQDSEVPQGFEEILDSLDSVHDNYDLERFDYSRQGERPRVDIDTGEGNFLSPSEEPIGDTVKTKGEGPDPEIIYPDPPTGGDHDPI